MVEQRADGRRHPLCGVQVLQFSLAMPKPGITLCPATHAVHSPAAVPLHLPIAQASHTAAPVALKRPGRQASHSMPAPAPLDSEVYPAEQRHVRSAVVLHGVASSAPTPQSWQGTQLELPLCSEN